MRRASLLIMQGPKMRIKRSKLLQLRCRESRVFTINIFFCYCCIFDLICQYKIACTAVTTLVFWSQNKGCIWMRGRTQPWRGHKPVLLVPKPPDKWAGLCSKSASGIKPLPNQTCGSSRMRFPYQIG